MVITPYLMGGTVGYQVFTTVAEALDAARSLQDFTLDQEKRAQAVGADRDVEWWSAAEDGAFALVTSLEDTPEGEVR